ncbi:DUF2280 domain-containing protein [Paraburkholderia diazotrophica]|uniref:DUF2280 domain-containing protein n=1 Tax=Paraburkholderia diazotrophica TaxID=667676 RepID=UPI00317D9AB4
MAALKDEVKAFIVRGLACFETPTEVARRVKEEFGLAVTAPQVQAYDPTKRQGRHLSKKWREMFESEQATFRADVAAIPLANQAFRMQELTKLYRKASAQGNIVAAASLIEQAAKEVGGSHTNRQRIEHTGAEGGPIKSAATVATVHPTPEEYEAIVRRVLDEY